MSMIGMTDYYGLLKVPKSAETDKIRKSYWQLACSCHPDKGGSNEAMARITEAWKTLSDPASRKQYDRMLSENNMPLCRQLPSVTTKTRKCIRSWSEFEKIYRVAYRTFSEDLEGVSAVQLPVSPSPILAKGKNESGLVVRVTVGKAVLFVVTSARESVAGHMLARSEILSLFIMAMVIGIGTGALMHILLH